jgi:hypothetical protein
MPLRAVEELEELFLELEDGDMRDMMRKWRKKELTDMCAKYTLSYTSNDSVTTLINTIFDDRVILRLTVKDVVAERVGKGPDEGDEGDSEEETEKERKRVEEEGRKRKRELDKGEGGEKDKELGKDKDKGNGVLKRLKKEKGLVFAPEISMEFSEVEGMKRQFEREVAKIYPDPASTYTARGKEESEVLIKALRQLAILKAMVGDGVLTATEVVDECTKIAEELGKRAVQIHVYETEGWDVAKHVKRGGESFLESADVEKEVKAARKVAAQFKGKSQGYQGRRVGQRGGYRGGFQQRATFSPGYGGQVGSSGGGGGGGGPGFKRDKSMVVCYGCRQTGHFKFECLLTPKSQGGAK